MDFLKVYNKLAAKKTNFRLCIRATGPKDDKDIRTLNFNRGNLCFPGDH